MATPSALRALLAASLASLPALAAADPACPTAVTDAAKRTFPDAAITKCVAEKQGFEVKMQRKDKTVVELDISAKGEIEQIEEDVPVASLPAAVTRAFAARYPRATMLRAEKQRKADQSVSFEIAFKADKGKKEATFKADGTFVAEE